jgi:hypothetical protein
MTLAIVDKIQREQYQEAIFKPLGYEPTPEQGEVHIDHHRVKQVSGGERGGKSVVGEKESLLQVPRSSLGWIVAQEYETCRTEFEYMMQDLSTLKLLMQKDISFPKEGKCQMTSINGCKIETISADDFRKIGRVAPDWILACEAAQLEFPTYLKLRGRIAEKRGVMILTGTMEGSVGWWPEYIKRGQAPDPEFRSFIIPTWSNHKIFPPGDYEITLMNGEIIKNVNKEIYYLWIETPIDVFMERYGAVPQPVAGLIAREFSNSIHVGDYYYNPNCPVEIAVDPGYGGAYAVLAIQIEESIPYIIDELYIQGYPTTDIIGMVKTKPWCKAITRGAIDIAAKQHQGQRAVIDVWADPPDKNDYYKGGLGLTLKCQYVEVDEGINTFRTKLKIHPVTGRAGFYVDSKCKGFIAECGGGKSPVQGGGAWIRDIKTNKIIDANNHSIKAFIYWLINRYGYVGRKSEIIKLKSYGVRYDH